MKVATNLSSHSLVPVFSEQIGLDAFHEVVKPLRHNALFVSCLLTDDLLPQLAKVLPIQEERLAYGVDTALLHTANTRHSRVWMRGKGKRATPHTAKNTQ